MGKYMRKCRRIGEVAVMEVAQIGVRMTRARAALAMAATSSVKARTRKVGGGEKELTTSLAQLRSRRRIVVTPENSVSPSKSGDSRRRTASHDPCLSPSSDRVLASCCSSNGSSEIAKERLNFVDLEAESAEIETSTNDLHGRERKSRETTPSSKLLAESGELELTARPSEANTRDRLTVEKVPSEAELEEFFAVAEKDLHKRFREKYNYDIVKDEPLEGRYEWVRLKP